MKATQLSMTSGLTISATWDLPYTLYFLVQQDFRALVRLAPLPQSLRATAPPELSNM